MRTTYFVLLLIMLPILNVLAQQKGTTITELRYTAFAFNLQLDLPGNPETIFDAATGDIGDWWDHSFSGDPLRFYIEPKPGGGFYEIFNEAGNGVRHATVLVADRGKMLRLEGPLGLSGRAILMVTTYEFNPLGSDSTTMKVAVHASGEVEEGLPEVVENVWRHFIFEQFKPYVESGKHLQNE